MTNNHADTGALLIEIKSRLARGETDRLAPLVRKYLSARQDSSCALPDLARLFERKGATEAFFACLLSAINSGTHNISVYSTLAQAGAKIGRGEKARGIIESALDIPARAHFGTADYLSWTAPRKSQFADLIRELKYGEVALSPDIHIFEASAALSEHIDIDQALLDLLWAVRRHNDITKTDWTRGIKKAFALDHILDDLVYCRVSFGLMRFVDRDVWTRVRGEMQSYGGLLVVTFHGGMLRAVRQLYETGDGWLTLQSREGVGNQKMISAHDARGALLASLKTLQEGGVLLMAPDGPWGTRTASIGIFHTNSPVGEGGAFAAFEAKCATAWLAVVCDAGKFLPILIPGPAKLDGETYRAFRERWFHFYAEQIEALLSGPPDNISLRPRWTRTLVA